MRRCKRDLRPKKAWGKTVLLATASAVAKEERSPVRIIPLRCYLSLVLFSLVSQAPGAAASTWLTMAEKETVGFFVYFVECLLSALVRNKGAQDESATDYESNRKDRERLPWHEFYEIRLMR